MQGNLPPSGGHQVTPSQEERVMAALAHASVLVHQVGLIAPLVLWLVNKDKAPYAAYQAKQAFWFHLAVTVIEWIVIWACILTLGLGLFLLWPIIVALPLFSTIYGIVGAVHSYNGRDFRYWLISDFVKPD
jgi:uncharacterized Tic20 family protein